jgi:hypothetical protein
MMMYEQSKQLANSMVSQKESIIKKHLPVLGRIEDLLPRLSVVIQSGIETFCFDDEPFIKFWPVTLETIHEDNTIKIQGSQNYELLDVPQQPESKTDG